MFGGVVFGGVVFGGAVFGGVVFGGAVFGGAYLGQIALGYDDAGPSAQRFDITVRLAFDVLHDAIDHEIPNRLRLRATSTTISPQKHNGRSIYHRWANGPTSP